MRGRAIRFQSAWLAEMTACQRHWLPAVLLNVPRTEYIHTASHGSRASGLQGGSFCLRTSQELRA